MAGWSSSKQGDNTDDEANSLKPESGSQPASLFAVAGFDIAATTSAANRFGPPLSRPTPSVLLPRQSGWP